MTGALDIRTFKLLVISTGHMELATTLLTHMLVDIHRLKKKGGEGNKGEKWKKNNNAMQLTKQFFNNLISSNSCAH